MAAEGSALPLETAKNRSGLAPDWRKEVLCLELGLGYYSAVANGVSCPIGLRDGGLSPCSTDWGAMACR
jgi:hypothetical protein